MTTAMSANTPAGGHPTPDDLLTADTVVGYLAIRSVLDRGEATVQVLGGGVSNVVLAVHGSSGPLVVKQSLPRLRVVDDWFAPQDRIITEAEALRLAARLVPDSVPHVIDSDPVRHTLTLERAPTGWRDWKTRLLEGDVDACVASRLGSCLASWHAATTGGQGLSARMHDTEAFEMLRTDPYYRTVARRTPELSGQIQELIDQMHGRRQCMVHGDFSPKNVLVGPAAATWVIDFEVAHHGDPHFDLAFLISHLLLKSVHRPELARDYDRCVTAFTTSYTEQSRTDSAPSLSWEHALRHVGCLLLARVRGKSPAEYLTPEQADRVWVLGRSLLTEPPAELSVLAQRRDEVL